jgi:hypothetical protein
MGVLGGSVDFPATVSLQRYFPGVDPSRLQTSILRAPLATDRLASRFHHVTPSGHLAGSESMHNVLCLIELSVSTGTILVLSPINLSAFLLRSNLPVPPWPFEIFQALSDRILLQACVQTLFRFLNRTVRSIRV